MASFHDFALVCQELGQTQSRIQMAEAVASLLASLDPGEAEVAARFMVALLAGVFAFFWTHMALWFYREYKDRKERKGRPYVKTAEAAADEGKYVRRFGPVWRLAHLLLAMSVMGLVLTGMSVLYGTSPWAPVAAASAAVSSARCSAPRASGASDTNSMVPPRASRSSHCRFKLHGSAVVTPTQSGSAA